MNRDPKDEAVLNILHDIDHEVLSINPEDDRLRPFAERRHPDLVEFFRERNHALCSGDEDKVRAVCRDWAEYELPEDPEMFRATIHKAITAITVIPPPFREQSRRWLEERGLRPLDPRDT